MAKRKTGGDGRWASVLLATTMLSGASTAALAQESAAPVAGNSDEIIVTAQKREENIQNVPGSVQAIGTEKLEQLNVQSFNDYAQFLPSLTYQSLGPGFARMFMRGVASGDNGNHSGPLPSVGLYLDEQPITTITGPLDIHVYDIARVEALAGPQGTLYGASSLAGTVRIITNKPDPSDFSAAYDVEANAVDHGGLGQTAEGYVNVPISSNVAVRLVGWEEQDAGYIDNVAGTRTYPSCGCSITNAETKKDYNTAMTYGARAALRVDLNENWTVTPTVIVQDQRTNGVFAYDPSIGDLEVTHFFPETTHDRWAQAALTINGRIGNFDLVYAGAHMNRTVDSQLDYTDYSFFYDTLFGYGAYIYDNLGNIIDSSQHIRANDAYTKDSHEIRIASPSENRLRFIGGLFMQRQTHEIEQRYLIDNLADSEEVPGWPDTIWLTEQKRVDRDYAAFGEVSYDFTDKLTATVGLRAFRSHNSLRGFFGYGAGFSSGTGEAACQMPEVPYHGAPCINLDREITENGTTHRVNLSYHITPDQMIYGTISSGFRPGGVNRRIFQQPLYKSDTIDNYEVGFKSTWYDGRLRFNAALFQENWKNFQFSFLGLNGLTENRNAGDARIRGVESDLTWRPVEGFTLSSGATYIDSEILQNYCSLILPAGTQTTDCPSADSDLLAPKGTELPVTPHLKADLTARYEWDIWGSPTYVQAAAVHQSGAAQDMRTYESSIIGKLPAYTSVDLSAGFETPYFTLDFFIRNAFDERGELYRYAECQTAVCGTEYYVATIPPRTFAVRFGQKF